MPISMGGGGGREKERERERKRDEMGILRAKAALIRSFFSINENL